MKCYVSYVLNRKNAILHRFNHGFDNNNKKAYNSLDEIKKDIVNMYYGHHASCEMARKVKMYIVKDTRGELVGFVNVGKTNGKYFLTWELEV